MDGEGKWTQWTEWTQWKKWGKWTVRLGANARWEVELVGGRLSWPGLAPAGADPIQALGEASFLLEGRRQ